MNPKQVVLNSCIVLEIFKHLDSISCTHLYTALVEEKEIAALRKYGKRITEIVQAKRFEEAEEYYRIRKTITNEEVGCTVA